MPFNAPAPKINWKDIRTFDFWRYLFKVLWIFFPGIFFLILGYFAFWSLSQGRDIMLITVQQGKEFVFLYCILAVLLWAFVTWYTSRLVGKAKVFQQQDENHIWIRLILQLPRLLGFSCFTLIIIAFLQLPDHGFAIRSPLNIILLIFGIPYYFLIYVLWEKFIKKEYNTARYLKFLIAVRNTCGLILLASIIAVALLQSYIGLIILFMGMQIGLVLLLIIRRKITELLGKSIYQQVNKDLESKRKTGLIARCSSLVNDDEDRVFSRVFLIISIIPFVCYIATIISVQFSIHIGSFPFAILAFSVLLILGNFVSYVSALARFNLHIVFWTVAFFAGIFSKDPHKVRLIEKQNASLQFEKRQTLKEYFSNWVAQDLQNPQSLDSNHKIPVYFVLADGGASRSGYWVASVLSRLEDSTHGKFSRNLFCLSGASGGSVGNATFFNILRNKKDLDTSCQFASRSYLGSDFLTYTLARMLGPDVFRYVLPFLMPVTDRGFALTKAMEEAQGKKRTSAITNMNVGMSEIMTQTGNPANLPILCINTTRMQDGSPAVISTINMHEYYFNKRIDVLSIVDEKKDIKLSSSVVLGASFPYLSPAGRIDSRIKDTSEKMITKEYFVDGGYFDNSGAGMVNEMIIGMMQLMKEDTALSRYEKKLDLIVLHITNDPSTNKEPLLNNVNPLVNDLAAPIKTLVGSYGSQTSVNDSRLENFMGINFGPDHYIRINLYKENDKMSFPMNWVISKRVLDSMDARLNSSDLVKDLWQKMNE